MNKTNFKSINNPILVNTEGLRALVQSGRDTAVKIGMAAGAKVKVGKSVRWNVAKIQKYLEDISCE